MGDVKKIQKAARKGRFLLPKSIIKSDAFLHMSGRALKVYLWMAAQYDGQNNGALTAVYRDLMAQCGLTKWAVGIALDELLCSGFVRVTRKGGSDGGAFVPSLYAITAPKLPIDYAGA